MGTLRPPYQQKYFFSTYRCLFFYSNALPSTRGWPKAAGAAPRPAADHLTPLSTKLDLRTGPFHYRVVANVFKVTDQIVRPSILGRGPKRGGASS